MGNLNVKNLAFIPLRGGSKSIPLKNIKVINGRPLIYWTLDAVVACNLVDKVIVSTDSNEIKKIVENYNSSKVIIINRSKKVSTDIATTESVMLEFSENNLFENIILVQATSPLLRTEDIIKGIRKFNESDFDSVISVVRQKRFIWNESNNYVYPSNYNPLSRPRRQDFNGYLVENGAFYITSREDLLSSKCRISGKIGAIEMSDESYYEIDEPSDWIIIEDLLNEFKKGSKNNNLKKIKCLLTDCDGVLTDSGMYYSENGDELKKFNTKDGMGFKLIKEKGLITGIISSENINLVKRRALKLNLDEIYIGVTNKIEIIDKICSKYDLKYDEIAYIGDDINDYEVINKVGFGCTVMDGMQSIKAIANYITNAKGGQGAVREVVELILNAKQL